MGIGSQITKCGIILEIYSYCIEHIWKKFISQSERFLKLSSLKFPENTAILECPMKILKHSKESGFFIQFEI